MAYTYDHRNKTAADEISLDELPPEQMKFVDKLVPHLGHPEMVWGGVHGYIVEFPTGWGKGRFAKDFLHMLAGVSVFRWIEAGPHHISVGM